MEFQTSKGNKNFFEISGVQDIGGGVVGAGEEITVKDTKGMTFVQVMGLEKLGFHSVLQFVY